MENYKMEKLKPKTHNDETRSQQYILYISYIKGQRAIYTNIPHTHHLLQQYCDTLLLLYQYQYRESVAD